MVKLMCCWLYFSCCSFRFCVVNPTVALISVYSMFGGWQLWCWGTYQWISLNILIY
jgi:hypothetical protein